MAVAPVLSLQEDQTLYLSGLARPLSLLPPTRRARYLGCRMIRLYIWPGLAPPAALNPPHMMNFIYFILTDSQSIPKTTEPLLLSLKDTTTKGSFTTVNLRL